MAFLFLVLSVVCFALALRRERNAHVDTTRALRSRLNADDRRAFLDWSARGPHWN